MSPLARRTRVILGLVAFAAALAAWHGAALGAISLTSGSIDGVQDTSSPPGGVLPAEVTGKVDPGSTWKATKWTIGGASGCYDHADYSPATGPNAVAITRTVNFRTSDGKNTVTAPGGPGKDYSVVYEAYATDNCSGTAAATLNPAPVLRRTDPETNRDLLPRCGIDVMLVLDGSGSIGNNAENVRNAARAFLTALSGTGSSVSIIDFSTSATRRVDYTTVTQDSIATVFEPYLVNVYRSNGWTNWEDAFLKVKTSNRPKPTGQGIVADLVVFVTDGDPTAMNNPPGSPVTGLTEGDVNALTKAQTEADLVKGQNSHILALGVGAAVNNARSASRLTAVSGFDQYTIPPDPPGASFPKADFTLVKDFTALSAALRQIATELCRASVTVTKLVDEVGDGKVYTPDDGWTFKATVSTKPGGFTWVLPSTGTGSSRETSTDDDGVATFQWKPTIVSATSTVQLDEIVDEGYEFVNATCGTNAPGRTRTRTVRQTFEPVKTITLGPNEFTKCTVRNRIIPGTIEIEKSANPEGSKAFPFVGSAPLGPFTLVDKGSGTSSSRTFTGLTPGTYTVRELVPDDWELTGVTCTPAGAAAIAGPLATITLAPGGSVVCTYRDTRTDPPVPPEPPTPPTPPTPPGPPTPPEPPTPPPSTQIQILKTAPRVARVGQRVPFELTVRNVGSVTAQGVVIADVPPATLRLAALQSTGATQARLARGNAYWQVGTLAPGAARTVRGSVLLEAGTPGLKRNLALAAAANAQIVQHEADTRVLQQRRVTPPVTG